jgi:hypothetical protein
VTRYRAYGLSIASDIALPELEADAGAGQADIVILLRRIEPRPAGDDGFVFAFGEDEQYLAWRSVGRFLIRPAGTIDVDPAPGVGEALLRLPLLGTVMALLLHLRGLLVLHASAIVVDGRGAVFAGDKQAGKSTTAAAFIGAGYRLLVDDVVAMDFSGPGPPVILPGIPQMKLSSAGILAGRGIAVPAILPGLDKGQHKVVGAFAGSPVPPRRVYVIERGARAEITRLAPDVALTSLLRFSYVARFGQAAMPAPVSGRHLRQCAALIGAAKVCRLEVPDGIDRLGEVVRLVERDCD